ncbi:MAG: N-acetylmuramoyl-L-alanine amidase [candidate division WOR-3 bacterium]
MIKFFIIFVILAPPFERIKELEKYKEIMENSAKEFGIDANILKIIGYMETRFHHIKCPSIDRKYGIMGISEEDTIFIDEIKLKNVPDFEIECELHDIGKTKIHYKGKLKIIAGDAENNIRFSAYLLKKYLNEENNNLEKALLKYFKGNEFKLKRFFEIYKEGFKEGIIEVEGKEIEIKEEIFETPELDSVNQFIYADSSNFTVSNRPYTYPIQYVIIHTAQGTYEGTIAWFRNPNSNVSAHYVLRSFDGHSTQMVRHKDIAWHAGNWTYNTKSIGIEHEGWIEQNGWYTDEMYKKSAYITRSMINLFGVPYDRQHIIGHNEVPGATHTDPGPYWDWTYYMRLVGYLPYPDTIVDDLTKGFKRGGPYSSWWFKDNVGYGYGGHIFWTYTWTNPVSNWARWTPNLPDTGDYEIFAYIPADTEFNAYVRYKIYNLINITPYWVNQGNFNGQWKSLGIYPMPKEGNYINGCVTLGDTSNVSGKKIAFDAIKFRFLNSIDIFPFYLIDDGDLLCQFYGNWNLSSYTGYLSDYRWAYTYQNDSVKYDFSFLPSGIYEVRVFARKGYNRTQNAHYRIYAQNGTFDFYVNQYSQGINEVGWIFCDTFTLISPFYLILYSNSTNGEVVISDAIKFSYMSPVDIGEKEVKDEYCFYKNGKLILNLEKDNLFVFIYDITGRNVYKEFFLLKGKKEIPLKFKKGIYFIKIKGERDKEITRKILKIF